ncbi:MAG TPA: PQQ-dependent catabolism-associated CXXCW motif protein [Beijerinckiaceae bacterium]|nr:PQQ-dependent catabolism-associated CXXCW motif protein [Beijerinckiaceae bacterium]
MRRARALAGSVALCVVLLSAATAQTDAPPEPDGYRMQDYRARVPATLRGATVLDTAAALALWKEGASVFVDVLPRVSKPANLPAGTVWRDPRHESLPGAIWLPNTGYGVLGAAADAYFRHGLEKASKGDMNVQMVFFCQRDCWMSWNAARRALDYGYRRVAWFPDGTDGWAEAGLPLRLVEPE